MASKKMYNNGGMANNYTSGDGDSFVSPKSMDIATMGKERMNSFSKANGLMGMRAGGDVMVPSSYGSGGGTGKGNARKGKKPGSRLAYD